MCICCLGDPQYNYEQSFGNGNWSDFFDLLYFVNTTHAADFDQVANNWLDVSNYIKSLIVENFFIAKDNYRAGQNYQFYHLHDEAGAYPNRWLLVEYDFDESFYFESIGVPSDSQTGLFSYFLFNQTTDDNFNPLSSNVLLNPTYAATYTRLYKQFLASTFERGIVSSPMRRYKAMLEFVLPWVRLDRIWQSSYGTSDSTFESIAVNTTMNLEWRYLNISQQLLATLSQS